WMEPGELPGLRRSRIEMIGECNWAGAGKGERKTDEWNRQPLAAGLDIRLLQGPVAKEHIALLRFRQRPQVVDFARRKIVVGHFEQRFAVRMKFDVDPEIGIERYRADAEPMRVRKVEA